MDDLSAYRLSMAEEKLYSSKILLDAGQYEHAKELYEAVRIYLS